MTKLPYLTSPGNLSKALTGIQSAAVPAKVTQDFVKTVLKIPGGSGDNMTTFLRRLGFANADGTPSEIYKRFRNASTSKIAVAEAMRHGYAEVFRRNTYAYKLSNSDMKGLVVEITGNSPDAKSVSMIVSTFRNMAAFADFEADESSQTESSNSVLDLVRGSGADERPDMPPRNSQMEVGLNLGYTINLNLPATTDIEVFNAIFKSLREHLLKRDD